MKSNLEETVRKSPGSEDFYHKETPNLMMLEVM
jgi:hypothetical protein